MGMSRTMTILGGALCALLAAPCARAEQSTVGGLGSAIDGTLSGVTLIDLSRPALKPGSFTNGTIYWAGESAGGCSASFTVKFYRPDLTGTSATSLRFLDRRGPFNVHPGLNDVTLSPPVALEAGDRIGVTEFGCGGVALLNGGGGNLFSSAATVVGAPTTLVFSGDTGTESFTTCQHTPSTIFDEEFAAIMRTDGTQVRVGIVPIVGSAPGAFGSNIVTSMQLVNPGSVTIQGELIFHPIGVAGSLTDPSMTYALGPYQVKDFPNIVTAAGFGSGLFSVDVMASSSYVPLVVTRIFNDGGAAGTDGYTENLVRARGENVIEAGEGASLVAPDDFTKFRWNIGVRSFSEGATFTIVVRGSDGSVLTTLTQSLLPDQLILAPATTFLGVAIIAPNVSIQIQVTSGRLIVFGTKVDDTTNNGSLQVGNKLGF